jgi:hypothetical protein
MCSVYSRTCSQWDTCTTSFVLPVVAAGSQGKLLVIKVILLIKYKSKALSLSEHMWSSHHSHPLRLSQFLSLRRQAWRWRRPPVAILLFGRVPGRASGPSQSSGRRRRRRITMYSGKLIGSLGFSHQGVFIGKGASSEVDRGGLTHRGHDQGPGHATLVCGPLVAPLQLLFGSLEAPVKFWATGFGFVQFREYFLCSFSETQKQ